MTARPASLGERVTKAIRVRGDAARHAYHAARRAGGLLRDRPRRAALRALVPTWFDIAKSDGFLVLAPGSFPEIAEVVTEAHATLARFQSEGRPAPDSWKRFLVNVLDPAEVTADSAIVRFALRDDVIAVVSRYLGIVPRLSAISVLHSGTVKSAPKSSQLHHCDGDDVTQVKVFVYCTEVDRRSGPLTVLSADRSARVRKAAGYTYRDRLTDAQVEAVLGPGGEHPILGPAGTAAFVDTSRCFHFGSRVEPGAPPRLVTMIQYQTPYAFVRPEQADGRSWLDRLGGASYGPLQRLVLGA